MLNKNLAKWLLLLFLIVAVVLISSPGSPWRRTVVVFSFLMALTDVLAPQVSGIRKLSLVIPVWTQDQFAGAIASIGGAVAYLSKSSGTLGRYGAWFVILASLYRLVICMVFTIHGSLLIHRLRSAYGSSQLPSVRSPYGVLVSLGGSARPYLARTLLKVEWSLWRFQRSGDPTATEMKIMRHSLAVMSEQSREFQAGRVKGLSADLEILRRSLKVTRMFVSLLFSERLKQRILMAFLTPDDLRRYEKSFREYVLANCSLCIGIIPAPMLPLFHGEGPDVRKIIDELSPHLPSWLGRLLRRGLEEGNRQRDEAINQLHFCLGPSILIAPKLESSVEEKRGYELVAMIGRDITGPTVPKLTSAIALCCLPTKRLDLEVPDELRKINFSVARCGLAPLADAYLRFRLSKSDVERFLCLFDCFEVLMKYSVFVLMRDGRPDDLDLRWLKKSERDERWKRPTLGAWKDWLIDLTNDDVRQRSKLEQDICAAWQKNLDGPVVEFVAAVKASGINVGLSDYSGEQKWNEWLQWFVNFRNVTKGHGGIEEKTVASYLAGFYATFLQLVSLLHSLALDARLMACCADATEIESRGWLRGRYRSSTLWSSSSSRVKSIKVTHELRWNSEEYKLDPYVKFIGNSVLTWHSLAKDGQDAYLDYLTGRIEGFTANMVA